MEDVIKALIKLHDKGEKEISKSQVFEAMKIEKLPSWSRYISILKEVGAVTVKGERRFAVYKLNKKVAEKYLKEITA